MTDEEQVKFICYMLEPNGNNRIDAVFAVQKHMDATAKIINDLKKEKDMLNAQIDYLEEKLDEYE